MATAKSTIRIGAHVPTSGGMATRSIDYALTIKAESPIYVRNGVPKSVDKDNPLAKSFNNINNEYFIPGSSIKGMLRSVMEIMSFGRMGNKVNDHRYSVRDFQNDTIYPKSALAKEVLCGWLFKKDGEYFLDDCGKPGRISHKTLDSLCKPEKKISAFYKKDQNITKDSKSAKAKYDVFYFDKNNHKFILDYTDVDRPIYKIDDHGKPGIIVFSGQPGVRIETEGELGRGKHLEFIFFNPEYNDVPVEEEAIRNFFFAYYEHDKNQQKDDWKWRKGQLDKGEKIPVFFRIESNSGKGAIKDIGLSLLYKITYDHSIKDAINLHQKEETGYDLAETIFGYTEKNDSLKGRVHVGHAFVIKEVIPLQEKNEVLAGPKASYYPNYIEQSPNNDGKVGNYKTFMDESAKIRGWKRYPVHRGDVKANAAPVIKGNTNEKMGSKFKPLPVGTEFNFQIHYHNLRKEELGALISAITFHNTEGLFHSIGSGKPLGYGKSSITIANLEEDEKIAFLKAYENYMDWALKNPTTSWFKSVQIKELFAMAKPGIQDDQLKYMKLDDFVNAKGRRRNDPKFALKNYSAIVNHSVEVTPLGSTAELKDAAALYETEEKFFEGHDDIQSLKQKEIYTNELKLEKALIIKKNELLSKVKSTRESNAIKEQQEKINQEKRERLEKAASGLPQEWNDINDFGNLSKRIEPWKNKLVNQVILEIFQDDLSALFKKIILHERTVSSKKKDWKGDFDTNKNFKKIALWLGEIKAKTLFDELNKTN